MTILRSLCVYCGSKSGTDPRFEATASELGRLMAQAGVRLVYGGGSIGLMGTIADSVLTHGGEVFGVIPKGLFTTEIGHPGLTELVEVGSMHERKALMAAEADESTIVVYQSADEADTTLVIESGSGDESVTVVPAAAETEAAAEAAIHAEAEAEIEAVSAKIVQAAPFSSWMSARDAHTICARPLPTIEDPGLAD